MGHKLQADLRSGIYAASALTNWLLPETMSRATPRGEAARPCEALSNALRITLTGTPCCSPKEQTTAESFAAESESLPALLLLMNISASSLVPGKYEIVAR